MKVLMINSGSKVTGHTGTALKVFEDIAVEIRNKAFDADGFVFASPVYFVHPTGRIQSVLHRSFYSDAMNGSKAFSDKPAVTLAIFANAGQFAALDVLNKFITIPGMQMADSTYWQNSIDSRTGKPTTHPDSISRIEAAAGKLAKAVKQRSANNGKEE